MIKYIFIFLQQPPRSSPLSSCNLMGQVSSPQNTLQPPQNPLLAMSNLSTSAIPIMSTSNVHQSKANLIDSVKTSLADSSLTTSMTQSEEHNLASPMEKVTARSPMTIAPQKTPEKATGTQSDVKVKIGKIHIDAQKSNREILSFIFIKLLNSARYQN